MIVAMMNRECLRDIKISDDIEELPDEYDNVVYGAFFKSPSNLTGQSVANAIVILRTIQEHLEKHDPFPLPLATDIVYNTEDNVDKVYKKLLLEGKNPIFTGHLCPICPVKNE